ncbi:MAG TPA: metallophosphoesterase, partial [Thermoanaerobaculia bacterium]|nr:metallophosphoesterase [Thermoanaerobaculia bacterium]
MKRRNVLFAALLALAPAARAADPVIAAAGDIACDPLDNFYNGGLGTNTACRMRATSDLALAGGYDAVLLLGDNQYLDGALFKYVSVFGPTWGRLGALLRPAPGNHEYETPGATGYFDYFGAAAGKRTEGWYSYELGTWHVVVLNSNCADVGGCGPGSPQLRWLAADLASHPRACTLAYWHHPRFSSGLHNDDPLSDAFWRTLYAAGADLVLAGHD